MVYKEFIRLFKNIPTLYKCNNSFSLHLISGRKEKISTNKTHSFLLVTEKDIGDLLMLKFKWEETNGWSSSSMLKMVSSWWTGESDGANMEVYKIRIRAGETQQK